MIELSAAENQAWLTERFVQLLFESGPASVLDVGCGSGQLLEACRAQELEATGLDRGGPRLDALRVAGFDVREGSAYALPFEDRSVDWITLRHVPHHLEDPAAAFVEALRVARRGVLLAEPCFDVSVASQRSALALDVWEKEQHRRRGMFHAEALELGPLLALLPKGYESEFECEVRRASRLAGRSLADFETEARELVAELPVAHAAHTSLRRLLLDLRATGLTWNGSLVVALARR